MKLLIVIPAYNEAPMIGSVIETLPKHIKGIKKIETVVVDDGSVDETGEIAAKKGAVVLRHVLNRGLGAALGTAFVYARTGAYDFVVTFDADGQHQAADIPRLLEPLLSGEADVAIGSRLLRQSNMPLTRKIINFLSNWVTFALFGIWTTDSQSGLRSFNARAISQIHLRSQRMEVSSELFKEIRRLRLRFVEIPIKTIYTPYSLTKGQRVTNAANVTWKLLIHRFN